MKRLFFLSLLIGSCALAVQAVPTKLPRKVKPVKVKPTVNVPRVKDLPSYGGSRRALMGVDYSIARHSITPAPKTALPTPTEVTSRVATSLSKKRSWLEQRVRALKAWNLRRERRARDMALLASQNIELAKAILPPLLPKETKLIPDQALMDMLPDTHPIDVPVLSFLMKREELEKAVALEDESVPALPFIEEPNAAYRGMALTPTDIRYILTNGLERNKTVASNRLNMSLAAGSRGAIRYFAANPVINVTSYPVHARFWGSKFLGSKPILTIVKIRGDFGIAKILNIDRDIPVEDIVEVITLLQIDGRPTWCRTQLGDANTLSITPYTWRVAFKE